MLLTFANISCVTGLFNIYGSLAIGGEYGFPWVSSFPNFPVVLAYLQDIQLRRQARVKAAARKKSGKRTRCTHILRRLRLINGRRTAGEIKAHISPKRLKAAITIMMARVEVQPSTR